MERGTEANNEGSPLHSVERGMNCAGGARKG